MNRTHWQCLPSFRYDTLCLLNTLTGDPFYVEFNKETYEHFQPLINNEAASALANLKRIIKDEGQSIISAMLCLYFSAVEAESLAEMQAVLDHPETMQANLQASPYYEEENWQIFMNAREDLRTVFRFLESINFPEYWQKTVLPEIEPQIAEIHAYLSNYDVVDKLENFIGYTLPSPSIQVYILHYTRPHGIKVIGQRFLTAASWKPQIALRTAIHEMLHPPYLLSGDAPLQAAIDALQTDPFIADKFANHDPSFGYNSFVGYVEENCVRALDQIVSEAFEIARNPQERWREEDGGMHVLAASLYHCLKTRQFKGGFRDVFLGLLQNELAPGKVEGVYSAFYEARL